MPLWKRTKVNGEDIAYESAYDPAPDAQVTTYSYETFEYTMDDFKARLGLQDNPHDILMVSIVWTGRVQVRMMSRLRATERILGCAH